MNVVRTTLPNLLGRSVHRAGGVTLEQAASAAAAKLEAIRSAVTEEVEDTVERLLATGSRVGSDYDGVVLDELYGLANTIMGMAGPFGLGSLGDVSFSLCELLDRMKTHRRWDVAAVRVHLDALRLLRPGAAATDTQRRTIVGALRCVVQRF